MVSVIIVSQMFCTVKTVPFVYFCDCVDVLFKELNERKALTLEPS